MNVVRVTKETDMGYTYEIGQYESMEKACKALEEEIQKIGLEKAPEDDPYHSWTVKIRWVNDQIPW